jgi:hypothetical protein
MDNHIIPECYLDTMLTECLVQPNNPKNGYNHQKGCSTVTKEMCGRFADDFAVGILDDDKKPTPYLKEMELKVDKSGLKLYKYPDKNHYLVLHPPIEKWILDETSAANIDLATYELPSERKALQMQTKTATSKLDQRFKPLFKALKDRETFNRLANWLSYLKQHPYTASIEHLKTL